MLAMDRYTYPKMRRASKNLFYHEIAGLVLLGAAVLLFLALVSYDSGDLPGGFFLATEGRSNAVVQNFIGRVGAIVAALFYFVLGASSFLVAVLLFGLGAVKLLSPKVNLTRPLIWMAVLVTSAACICQLQTTFFQDWAQVIRVRPGGAGGELGYWLGARLMGPLLGKVGSLIVLGFLYFSSLVLMTGIHPMTAIRATFSLFPRTWAWWSQRREVKAKENAKRESEEARRLQQEERKTQRATSRRGNNGAAKPAEEPQPAAAEFDADRPAPQVIDTTAPAPRKPPAPRKEKAPLDPFRREGEGDEMYELPGFDLLDEQDDADRVAANPDEMLDLQAILIDTLAQFGISVAPGDITRGPTITRYEVYPAKGVRVDKIVSLERDLARATCAERINILAPIPGKDTVGIEIANSRKQKVTLRELLESDDWEQTRARIPLLLGKDVYGRTILGDLAAMPHLLVAGTTGSGKSVCINSIIASIVYRFKPSELQFIMIDPKVVEMQVYNDLPHLAIPVVTDTKKVLLALRWVIDEMEKRYKIFAKAGVRNIATFNARPKPKTQKELDEEAEAAEAARGEGEGDEAAEEPGFSSVRPAAQRPPWEEASPDAVPQEEEELPEPPKPVIRVRRDDEIEIPEGPMSYIVVIVDELADLMQTAPADVESAIARITQMARAAGIHMIVATQTPRADVITGVIKANIPTRIAFQVASGLDSRIILDEKGAERLLGQGDMLYVPPGTSRMTRAQGVFVTDDEIRRLVEFASQQSKPQFNADIEERLSEGGAEAEEVSDEDEELVEKCIEIMRQERKVSTSLFQRRLRLGYTRAARVVDILEQRGYVAPGEGAKPREILIDLDTL